MHKKDLEKTIIEYMASHHTLSLATDADGSPHAAAVFYVNIGLEIYFLSSPTSRHGMNMARNARVSATINEDYAHWQQIKGIQLEGHVRNVGGILQNGKLVLAFLKKFPDVTHFFSSPQKLGEIVKRKVEGIAFYKLIPHKIFFIDNEEGFGHRDELLIDTSDQAAKNTVIHEKTT